MKKRCEITGQLKFKYELGEFGLKSHNYFHTVYVCADVHNKVASMHNAYVCSQYVQMLVVKWPVCADVPNKVTSMHRCL